MKTIVLVAVFLAAVSSGQEQGRPTTKQCRADLDAWYSGSIVKEYENVEDQTPSSVGSLPIPDLLTRKNEMEFCSVRWQNPENPNEEPDNREEGMYKDAALFYTDVLTRRYFRFIERHKLYKQMMTEDAEGVR
jgi:uncharacterized protein Veg